jgi:hypothetical protein
MGFWLPKKCPRRPLFMDRVRVVDMWTGRDACPTIGMASALTRDARHRSVGGLIKLEFNQHIKHPRSKTACVKRDSPLEPESTKVDFANFEPRFQSPGSNEGRAPNSHRDHAESAESTMRFVVRPDPVRPIVSVSVGRGRPQGCYTTRRPSHCMSTGDRFSVALEPWTPFSQRGTSEEGEGLGMRDGEGQGVRDGRRAGDEGCARSSS